MSLVKEIKVKELELKELKSKKQAIDKIKASDSIICHGYQKGRGCGKKIKVKDIDLIQTHWYTPPYGCTGGDYYNLGESNFICPKCKTRNRPCWNKEFNLADMDFRQVKGKFKSVTDEYE